jgi:endonuclease-3
LYGGPVVAYRIAELSTLKPIRNEDLGSRTDSPYHSDMKSPRDAKKLAARVRQALAKLYPDAACALKHEGSLQLLIATILSAQCTDVRVNLVTPALFARFSTAKDFAEADSRELESAIQSTGFFRNKAKNIKECCRIIVDRFGSEVPGNLEDLVQLPGVGRKTANVVLGNCFETPGITVDTHVGRLSRRMGLTVLDDPVKVEHDLMRLIPKKEWTIFSHRMILHGRQVCFARNPNCAECALASFCPKVGVI